jgi:hypothetical protein
LHIALCFSTACAVVAADAAFAAVVDAGAAALLLLLLLPLLLLPLLLPMLLVLLLLPLMLLLLMPLLLSLDRRVRSTPDGSTPDGFFERAYAILEGRHGPSKEKGQCGGGVVEGASKTVRGEIDYREGCD